MAEFKQVNSLVKEILTNDKNARNSDNYLFVKVYETIGKQNGIDVSKMSMPDFFLNMKENKLPSVETIRRTRQKLQQTFECLRGDSDVEGFRKVKEEEYKQFSIFGAE